MDINFDEIGDINDYDPVPEGTYTCRVAKVEEKPTRRGDEMWLLHLEIEDGEFAGRVIFDRLIFSKKALRRVKKALWCLGVDVGGTKNVPPNSLVGRRCSVHAVVEDYFDQEGEARTSNAVPFDGYAPVDDDGLPH
jgi:hypothetical protein